MTNRELNKHFRGVLTRDDGTPIVGAFDIRQAFLDELALGHEVVPFGKPCEGFDYKHGCPGHPVLEATPRPGEEAHG